VNALILGGSWNIIGWVLILIVLAIIGVVVSGMLTLAYVEAARRVSFHWHLFWCKRGRHKKGAITNEREQVVFEDPATQDRVWREYAVRSQRCTKCVKLLTQEKKLEKEDRFSRQFMRNAIPFGARWAERH
jgi:hypothetical protein